MYTFLVILLVVFGVALLVAEMFLIPGFGAAGVFGVIALAASVAMAYITISPMAGHITLLAVLLLCAAAVYAFLKGKTLDKMALKTDVSSKVDRVSDLQVKEGDVVTTCSRLAPMGNVRVGDTEVEARSLAGFIDPETPVSIVRIEGNILLVKPVE